MTSMADRLAALLERAERRVPGPEGTAALWHRRGELLARYNNAVSYELVLTAEGEEAWRQLLGVELRKLGTYLTAKRQGNGGPWVTVALWHKDELHLFDAISFLTSIAEIEGCRLDAITARLRTVGAESTPLLPGPRRPN
jgi:hypothetical protein